MNLDQKIEELRSFPQFLKELIPGFHPSLHKVRPPDGSFSLTEQVCHLRDLEREGYLFRIQTILREDRPDLPEFDGAKIARERNYHSEEVNQAFAEFNETRKSSVALLAQLTDDQLKRAGRLGKFGIITMEQLMDLMVEHDRSHKSELLALKELKAHD